MTTIITKNSSTSTAVPASGDLTKGELAVNVTDKKLYTKDNSGTVVKLVGSLGNQEASAAAITGGTSAGVAITGGTINNTPIGATTAAAVTGTTVTATTGFVGALTGDVTGNTTGTHTGAVTGNVTGNLTGNVTASTGTSSFNNVTINGGLDMNAGTTATITNLTTPTNSGDAATKGYVDTSIAAVVNGAPAALDTLNELAAALGNDSSFATTVTNSIAGKLPLAGGTMTGAIAMGTNKITGLGTPTAGTDAATKTYVDTSAAAALPLAGGTMTGNIVMGSNKVTSTATPTTNDDLTRKGYVDSILGSATSAATSAANAATSETNAANSASAASTSASNASASASAAAASYDSFDDRYLGPKSSAPSVDNDGNALLTGALYWNTATNTLYVWTGSTWTQAAFTASGFLTAGNNLSDVSSASTARTNLGLAIGTNVQAWDADLDTWATKTAPSGTVVGTTDSQTLTNKTLTTPTLTTPNITTGLTIAGSAGTSGQVLTSAGSEAAPTWTTPATNGATFTAVATGTISNGRMVNLKSDGTVEMVGETTTTYADSIPAGSTTQFNDGVNATYYAVAWNESVSSQFLLVYYDTSDSRGKAVVGTVSGTTISFGTETQVNANTPFESPSVCCVPGTNDRYVIVWRGYQERGRSVVASVSGTSVSMGTEYTFTTSTSVYATCVASVWADSGKVVASYFDNSNGNYATCIVGSVSGTDISWGNRVVVNSSDSLGATSITFSKAASNGTGIVIYRKNGDGNGYGKVVTVSGSTLSAGSEATWNSAGNASSDYTGNSMFISASQTGSTYQYAIVNKDATTSYGYVYGATVSGTTITFSSGTVFESNALTSPPRIGFDKYTPSKPVISYATASATYAYSMSMSGSTITLGTKNTVYAGTSSYAVIGFSNSDTTARTLVIAYRGASNVPYAVVGTSGYSVTTNNLSSTLFVGASAGNYSNGDTATIYVKGAVSTAQTGLTVNSTYYLQANGTLSTTAASPSVLVGRALASTKILIGTT